MERSLSNSTSGKNISGVIWSLSSRAHLVTVDPEVGHRWQPRSLDRDTCEPILVFCPWGHSPNLYSMCRVDLLPWGTPRFVPTGSSEGWALVWEGSLTTGLLLLADVICVRLGHQNGTDTLIWGDSHIRHWALGYWWCSANVLTWAAYVCTPQLLPICVPTIVSSLIYTQRYGTVAGILYPAYPLATRSFHPTPSSGFISHMSLPGWLCITPPRAFKTIALQWQQALPTNVLSCLQMIRW